MKPLPFLLLATSGLGLGCHGGSSSAGPSFLSTNEKKGGAVVAHIGEETITADEVLGRLSEKSPFDRARMVNNLPLKKDFVEKMARMQLLSQEAVRRGLDKDPEVVRAAQMVMVKKLTQQEVDENPAKNIPDDELRAFYQAHLDDYVRPEMVHLSAILLATPDATAATKRLPEAQAILDELQAKKNDFSAFGQVARLKSEDAATKNVDGDLRFASSEQLTQRFGPEVAKAGFALTKPGQISDVVITSKGLFILKLGARSPALSQSFEQVKAQVRNRAWFEKRSKIYDAFLEDLKKKANFSIDEAALDKLQIQPTSPTVPGSGNLPPPGSPTPPPGTNVAQMGGPGRPPPMRIPPGSNVPTLPPPAPAPTKP